MTEHETFPGKPYVVTSKAGCTITDASGELEETCEPGKQKVVHAPSEKLFTSAPAIVRETFNRAAFALGQPGGGALKGIYVQFNATKTDVLSYKTNGLTNGRYLFYGAAAFKSFNGDTSALRLGSYMFVDSGLESFTGDLSALTEGSYMFQRCPLKIFSAVNLGELQLGAFMLYNTALTLFEYDLPKMTNGNGMFEWAKNLERFNASAPKMTNGDSMFQSCTVLNYFCSELDSLSNGARMFRYDTAFTTFEAELPALSSGADMFSGCKLDKASALRVLTSIPNYSSGSHPLTIGIHVDHQSDEDVVNAITEAEAKGWTLTVQWNGRPGTSTASTWGLRRKPVYARLGEPMADGTPSLDWGHYVTDPSGYTEFASLEEAKEYFNIAD